MRWANVFICQCLSLLFWIYQILNLNLNRKQFVIEDISEEDLNVYIRGDSPHGTRKTACTRSSVGDALTFTCDGISRFLNIMTTKSVQVTLWIFKGHGRSCKTLISNSSMTFGFVVAFSELFYGCFEHKEDTSSFSEMSDLRDCIASCSVSKDTYAGIKVKWTSMMKSD